MAAPPKRPGPPAPDPNWELELHPPAAGARKSGPESKDPLLAHALLHTAEPEPLLELDLFEEFGELERATLPPPEAMNVHVAKMMAAASLLEAEEWGGEEEGDRPTPLFELPESSRTPVALPTVAAASAAAAKMPAAGAKAPAARASSGGPTPLKTATAALAAGSAPSPKPSQKAAMPAAQRAVPPPKPPPRTPTSPGMQAQTPHRTASSPGMQAQAPHRTASSPGLYAASPGRTPSSSGMPATAPPRTASSPTLRAATVEARPAFSAAASAAGGASPAAVKAEVRAASGASATAGPANAAQKSRFKERRISSLSAIPDLPAVFAVDDTWTVDEPGDSLDLPGSAERSPPSSGPAISPPFNSGELRAAAAAAAGPSADQIAAIETRYAAGDYGRALVLAEAMLEEHPGEASISKYAEGCRDMLYQRYLERLGAADHVPKLAMQGSALTGLALDHRAGFLVSCVDGVSTVEEIIDVSAMPRLDAVRLLYELMQEGIIEMASPR